jgi:glycosyltransferase involved in cell wall biosynthesis
LAQTTIITCTRLTSDRLPYLEQAWTSLLAQTQQDFHWKVVLDDPVNPAPAFLNGDRRIHVIRSWTNVGSGPARTRALEQTTTPYVCTLDDDDVLPATSLEVRERFLDENPTLGWVGAHMTDMAPDGTASEDRWEQDGRAGAYPPGRLLDVWEDPARWFPVLSHTFLLRTDLVRRIGGWEPGMLQDIGVIAKASELTRGAVLDDVVYRWRKHRGQVTNRVEGVERVAQSRHIWQKARALQQQAA